MGHCDLTAHYGHIDSLESAWGTRHFGTPESRSFDLSGNMKKNGIFIRLLAIELLIAGGENFRNTLSLFFVQDYVGADKVGRLYVIYFGVGVDRHSLLGLVSQKVRPASSPARFCHGVP